MLALYRSGRQVDALRVFRDGRRTLVEQLGVEPSDPLRRLHDAILRHDPSLDLGQTVHVPTTRPTPTLCMLPPPDAVLQPRASRPGGDDVRRAYHRAIRN